MLSGKKVIAIYQALLLHAMKWVFTGAMLIIGIVLVVAVADRISSGPKWSHNWEGVAFGVIQLIILYSVRRIVVNVLNRRKAETGERDSGQNK